MVHGHKKGTDPYHQLLNHILVQYNSLIMLTVVLFTECDFNSYIYFFIIIIIQINVSKYVYN